MLLRMVDWNRIRDKFSEDEKTKLNAAINGETICPRGCTLDEQKLGEELTGKIMQAKRELVNA
jgi:hypothetical protein